MRHSLIIGCRFILFLREEYLCGTEKFLTVTLYLIVMSWCTSSVYPEASAINVSICEIENQPSNYYMQSVCLRYFLEFWFLAFQTTFEFLWWLYCAMANLEAYSHGFGYEGLTRSDFWDLSCSTVMVRLVLSWEGDETPVRINTAPFSHMNR